MSKRLRTEKPTLRIDPAIVARGPRAVFLADQISALGGSLEMTDAEIRWTVPEDKAEKAAVAVAEFCACGAPATCLVPAGDDFEGAEADCWECAEKTTVE